MQTLKIKRRTIFFLMLCFTMLYLYHYNSALHEFYMVPYEKTDISEIIRSEKISDEDLYILFRQTGVAPDAAKELIENKKLYTLERLHDLYFQKPDIKKKYIAYPITMEERNSVQKTPLVNLKKGDILISFNTHTLNWRHGHCGILVDEEKGTLLEHMSVGKTSCKTYAQDWGEYPGFMVLRYREEEVSEKAAEYAEKNLLDIRYSFFAGMIKKINQTKLCLKVLIVRILCGRHIKPQA